MAIKSMSTITKVNPDLKTADFDVFKTALQDAEVKSTPAALKHVDDAVDQMIARWKNSTKKVISAAEWDELTLLCKKIYYHRENNKATVSREIWSVLKDNFL